MASDKNSGKGKKREPIKDEETINKILEEIREDISEIKADISEIKADISEIKAIITEIREETPVMVRVADSKEVPFEEAKSMVENFLKECFAKQETVYPSEVADELGIDYELVRNVMDRLIREDKLEKDEGGD